MSSTVDQIPAHVRAILALFDDELDAVRFGDLDGSALAEQRAAVEEAAAREAEVYAALQDARRALDRALFELEERADRAAAYARVYARDHEPLAARLDQIAAMRPSNPPKPKRKRKAKGKPESTKQDAAPPAELPFEPRVALAAG